MFGFTKKQTVVIKINGMHCPKCAEKVNKALSAVKGVTAVDVNLESKSAAVKVPEKFDPSLLKAAVINAGFEVAD